MLKNHKYHKFNNKFFLEGRLQKSNGMELLNPNKQTNGEF